MWSTLSCLSGCGSRAGGVGGDGGGGGGVSSSSLDALHDPGSQTNSPGSKPLSVELEGERIGWSSLHVEADNVEMNDDHVENNHNTQQSPRRPVDTTDGDERHPNGPTEPPDEEKGADGGYGEQEVKLTVKHVETNELGRVEGEEVEHIEGVEDVKDAESRESR
ncbi:hypothetical protein PAXINDRAFT_18093 [Paxillus involutus ATCC 200175]|uniref:Uncharacterized protein n=1 Tax=Paxillus involutus ATCC 200175 TaxID=664439 RepID=A0A0C9SZP1_PAXIN|nr:hypothetical protein PAXINDRAFT_18093 [Paxillus involutus ATCC 200175]